MAALGAALPYTPPVNQSAKPARLSARELLAEAKRRNAQSLAAKASAAAAAQEETPLGKRRREIQESDAKASSIFKQLLSWNSIEGVSKMNRHQAIKRR